MGDDDVIDLLLAAAELQQNEWMRRAAYELQTLRSLCKPIISGKFTLGQPVRKISGSRWRGRVVGWYSTNLTPLGYAVESSHEVGSVQIYPAKALEFGY